MAVAETARLIASLELQDRKFQQGVNRSLGGLGKLEGRLGRLGSHASRGVKNAAANMAKLGAVATGVLVVGIQQGISSLAELEDATTAVDGAIKQTGKTGQVTSKQIAEWANQIESSVQAAFDDKEIVAGAGALLRYGNVTTENLKPALVVMTDLAAKTGDVQSASTLLARALADPTKASARLTRQGIVFTKQQQKQIETLVKAGKVGKAQALVLELIAKRTKGAAAASKGEFNDMKNTLADTVEDAQRLLAIGAMPVLQKLGTRLQEALGDKETMAAIKGLGQGAADVLDKAIEFGSRIPWDTVKQAFVVMGTGSKALLDAFVGLPPWVQTAVITGWGLNKLTGGALGSIVGELGKGLIKGVLGMTAGVVNINAGVVRGGGAPIPGVGAAGGGAGLLGALGAVGLTAATITGLSIGIGAAVGAALITDRAINEKGGLAPALKPIRDKGLNLGTNVTVKDATFSGTRFLGGKGSSLIIEGTKGQPVKPISKTDEQRTKDQALTAKVEAAKQAQVDAIRQTGSTTGNNIRGTTTAVMSSQNAIVAAINAIDLRPPIVNVNVTPTSVEKNTTVINRYGTTTGSYGGSGGNSSTNKYL